MSSNRLTLEAAHSIPLETVELEGRRYVVRADLGLAERVPLMVHGNARVALMLTHAVASRLTGAAVPAAESYGYSERGRGSIPAPVLRLGAEPHVTTFADLPDASVFDFTDDPDTRVGGMLGLELLRRARTAVDFAGDRLLVGVGESSPGLPALLRLGYLQLPMSVAADGRLTIDAWFPSIKALLPITPSTVANALTLHRQRFEGSLEMQSIERPDRSPIGTTPDRFAADDVQFDLAGAVFREPAILEDLAEYAGVPEKALTTFGMLGFDWMKAHRAVVDYANLRLYVGR